MTGRIPRGRVVVVGSLNRDLVLRVPALPGAGETVLADSANRAFGGKGANQAVAAAAAGAPTILVGAVGDDADGRAYQDRLLRLGVEARLTVTRGTPTGLAVVCVDARGENAITVASGANADVTPELVAESLADLTPADVVVLQLELPLPAVVAAVERARAVGARVLLNLAPYADVPGRVLAYADPVVVNAGEAERLAAAGLTASSLVVTRGADGATWGELAAPAARATVVDTTGAGDAFCGGLAAALAAGADRAEALRAGAEAAARVVAHAGAQPEAEGQRDT